MGNVGIRYYVTRGGDRPGSKKWGYWAPCLARRSKKTGQIEPTLMAELGFALFDCGEDGPLAWARAEMWNARWDEALRRHRMGEPQANRERQYPPGSMGEGFAKFRSTNAWGSDKKLRTREDWERGWRYIDPVFGDVDGNTVALEDVDLWYSGDPNNAAIRGMLETVGVREAHRAMKIWRALWNVLGTIKREDGERYVTGKDPSLGIRRKTPKARNAIWLYDEAERMIARAGAMGFMGLQAAMAVAWDTMLSPVDVRGLSTSLLGSDSTGSMFSVDRAKTGKAAIGTLTPRTEQLLQAYIASLPFTLHPTMPIFHTRGGKPIGRKGETGKWGGDHGGGAHVSPRPYTKDTLGDDFRAVRDAEFPGDKRWVSDFRRSGAVEAKAGKVDLSALAEKMANSIDSNSEIQSTYLPIVDATVVRLADEARERGRPLLRDSAKKQGSGGST